MREFLRDIFENSILTLVTAFASPIHTCSPVFASNYKKQMV